MKTSESIKAISSAILKSQAKITSAAKNSYNPHFKNKYADLQAVIDAVKDILNENGIAFIQSPSESADGRLNLTTRFLHESGEWIEDTASCPLSKQDPQGYGSALTYLRRYSLASFTGLYQEDDDGQSAVAKEPAVDIFEDMTAIAKAESEEALKTLYIAAVKKAGNNSTAKKALEAAKDQRKKELA